MCLPPRLPSDVFDRLYHLPDPTHDPTNENHYKSLAILVALKQPKFLCRHVILQRAKGMEFTPLVQHVKNTDLKITCTECNKPRIIYGKKKYLPQLLANLK